MNAEQIRAIQEGPVALKYGVAYLCLTHDSVWVSDSKGRSLINAFAKASSLEEAENAAMARGLTPWWENGWAGGNPLIYCNACIAISEINFYAFLRVA